MQHCNIILRTLGAILMALTLVLIPLSQAEATSCSNINPGGSTSYCDVLCAIIQEQGGYTLIKRSQVTITRPGIDLQCTRNEVCGGGPCWDREEPPLIIEPEPESAQPKKRRR